MNSKQYEATLLEIYNLCEMYSMHEGVNTEGLINYMDSMDIKMDVIDFYHSIVSKMIKEVKAELNQCELEKTYATGSIIPPPKQNLVITHGYLEDIGMYVDHLRVKKDISTKVRIQLGYNFKLSALIGLHYQLKWSKQILQNIRSSNVFFSFLMSGLNDE